MRSTVFNLERFIDGPDYGESKPTVFEVPMLPAYSIEYATLTLPPGLDSGASPDLLDGDGFNINGKQVMVTTNYNRTFFSGSPRLVVHYNAIRDYALLFPSVKKEKADGLGEYYREAEANYASGAWLSFCLMAGSIYEGLLQVFLEDEGSHFVTLIENAKDKVIDEETAKHMNEIREMRNLTHLNNHKKPLDRILVVDIRKELDRIVKKFSYL